jgi:hypothetical protein
MVWTLKAFVEEVLAYETKWGYRPLRASLNREDYVSLKKEILFSGNSPRSVVPVDPKDSRRYQFFKIDGVEIVNQSMVGEMRML